MITRARVAAAFTITALALSPALLRADVKSEQKTHVEFAGMLGRMVNMFGGKGAREGVTSSVAVKGDRKATMNDATGQIIDLAEEKIYDLDLRRKTYKVTTFAELRRQMEEAQKKAEENASKADREAQKEPAGQNEPQAEIDFDVKNTGQTKTINGYDTHETVMTVTVRQKGKTLEQGGGLVMTSDMWMAPKIAAMQEVASFDMRYAQALAGPMVAGASAQDMAAAMTMYPMMKDALARMRTEGAKMDGTPIMTTVTMDAVKSPEQLAEEKQNSDEESAPSMKGGLGGMFGGLAKKMAKKKAEGDSGEPKARTTFMTMTSEVLKVTPDVTAADVAIPAGFKER